MAIVDSQVHIWRPNTPEHPWPAGAHAHSSEPFTQAHLIKEMDDAGVDAAVIVTPSWEGTSNETGLAAARLFPDRLAVMGRIAMEDETSHRLIDRWKDQGGMLGIRLTFFRTEELEALENGSVEWLWGAAERLNIPIMVYAPFSQLEMGDIARRHPDLKLIIDHMGRLHRGRTDDGAFFNFGKLLALAAHPNIAVKASALPNRSTESYPFASLHKYIRQAFDAFGPRRLFWGSDITRLPCSYRQAVTMFTEELSWLSGDDRDWVMGKGICEWLGWSRPLHAAANRS